MRTPVAGVMRRSALLVGGLGIIAILYVVVLVLPLVYMLFVSIGGAKLGISQGSLSDPLLAYERFWADGYFRDMLWRTFTYALATAIACIIVGLPLAHLAVRGSPVVRAITLIAVVNPLFVNVIIRSYGLGKFLEKLGFYQDFWAVLIGFVQVLLPFMVLPLMVGVRQVDPLTQHAARTLGAGPMRVAMKVTLPTLLPALVAGSALVFIFCFNVFSIPLLLGDPTKPTVAQEVYNSALGRADFALASAIAMIMLAIVLLVLLIQRRLTGFGREGIL